MIGPVPIVIRTPFAGAEERFDREIAVREQREQHWSGGTGKGGDVRPSSSLNEVMMDRGGEMCDRLMSEHGWSEADFRYAAGRLEAAGDPDLHTLGQHMRAMELYAAEEFERRAMQMANAQESMTRQLIAGQSEEYLREQRTPVDRPAAPDQHPRQRGWMNYPTNARPQTIDDREARGARDLPLSAKILDAAREMARLANDASDTRQRNRIAKYASYLRQMYARQLEREDASEAAMAGDDVGSDLDEIQREMQDDRARANGAQPDDVVSFNDWSDRPTADEQLADDVRGQLLDEDLPNLSPGRRAGEDQLGDPSLHADEPEGLRRNRFDDFRGHVRRGTAPFGAGQPRGGDRFGGQRSRYSAESMREAADLTPLLLEDQRIHWLGSHGSW